MPPGKDGRARRRALDLDVVVGEADALAGKLVDARRGYGAAVPPEISTPDVVQQDEDNVGFFLLRRLGLCHFSVPFMLFDGLRRGSVQPYGFLRAIDPADLFLQVAEHPLVQ